MRFARVLLLLQACSALLHQPRRSRRAQPLNVGTSLDDFPAARCTDAVRLKLTGRLPQWLAGAVVRNGPGRFTTAKQNCSHLFDGMALLSRFDLLWLILDQPDHEHDKRLAEHVAYVHRYEEHPPLEFETLDAPFMRAMISHAR